MSGEALGWAVRQHTGDVGSQCVLLLLALRADEAGEMTEIDADYFAARACLSRRTIFRCFGALRDLGLFETEVGFARSGGRKLHGRLRLDVSTAAMQKTQASEGVEETVAGEGSADFALPETGQVVQISHQGSAKSALPSLCSKEDINNPPNPPCTEARHEAADEGEELEAWLVKFQASYPFDATMSVSEVRRAGAALSLKDRAKALRWAAEYAADLKRRGATRPLDAARWLRERRFAEVEAIKDGRAKAIGLGKSLVFVAQGTRAWQAWVAHGHKPGLNTSTHQGRNGWWFPALWPPGVDPPAAADEAAESAGGRHSGAT